MDQAAGERWTIRLCMTRVCRGADLAPLCVVAFCVLESEGACGLPASGLRWTRSTFLARSMRAGSSMTANDRISHYVHRRGVSRRPGCFSLAV